MQNTPLTLRRSAGIVAAFAALCSLPLSAASVSDWTGYGTKQDYSDMNTNHPVIGNGSADSVGGHTLYAVTPKYTLGNVGDSLTFSGNANFAGIASAQPDQFRFGIYDSNGTSPGTDAANVSGWLGYFATNAGTAGTADQRSRLWKRPEGNTTSFGSSGGIASNIAWAGAPGNTLISGDYSFSMVLTKTEDGINIKWTLTGLYEGATYAISGNYTDTDPNAVNFDRVGIFVGGGINAEQLSLSDLDLTFTPAIPEPAATAAFLGLGIAGVALLRRRMKR